MKDILDFLKRNAGLMAISLAAAFLLKPAIAEINTMLLVILFECLALSLSGLALYAYTQIDFTKKYAQVNPGLIFAGVHICTGLIVLGVYIAQSGV